MGTYLKFRCEGRKRIACGKFLMKSTTRNTREGYPECLLSLWDEEDVRIEQAKIDEGGRGMPDYLPLGHGDFKLSSTPDKDVSLAVRVLGAARKRFGLVMDEEPDLGITDYLGPRQLAALYDPKWFANYKAASEAEHEVWRKAEVKARKTMAKRLPEGSHTAKTWGVKRCHLVFCSISDVASADPYWYGYRFDRKGEITGEGRQPREMPDGERWELHRDAKGRGFLAIPLVALGDAKAKGGMADVRGYLERAWSIGLRSHPDLLLIEVYHAVPAKVTVKPPIHVHDSFDNVVLRGTYWPSDKQLAPRFPQLDFTHESSCFRLTDRSDAGGPTVEFSSRSPNKGPAWPAARRIRITYRALAELVRLEAERDGKAGTEEE